MPWGKSRLLHNSCWLYSLLPNLSITDAETAASLKILSKDISTVIENAKATLTGSLTEKIRRTCKEYYL